MRPTDSPTGSVWGTEPPEFGVVVCLVLGPGRAEGVVLSTASK